MVVLTLRERQILERLREGFQYKAIAESLGISYFTVKGHMRLIFAKLQARGATEAVITAIRLKLIGLE